MTVPRFNGSETQQGMLREKFTLRTQSYSAFCRLHHHQCVFAVQATQQNRHKISNNPPTQHSMMEQSVAPLESFYFCSLKCHLTLGTFIHFQRVVDEQLEEGIGQVLQVSHDVPEMLLIRHFVTQDFLHKLFPALVDVCFVQDTLTF